MKETPMYKSYAAVAPKVQDFPRLLDAMGEWMRRPYDRENMPRNRLAIVPDLTHYDMFASPRLADTVLPFLNDETGAKSEADQAKERQSAQAR